MASFCEGCGQAAISVTKEGRPICPDCIEDGYGEMASDPPMPDPIKSTAADREAAARQTIWSNEQRKDVLSGKLDRNPNVQAFSLHAQQAREQALEEALTLLRSSEPDEEAAGCPASWGDFLQIAEATFRALKEQRPC